MDATEIITARKAAEEAREVFRVLFEESPMPVLLFDPATLVIERANGRACLFYGVRAGEMAGSFLSEWVSPDEWPRTQEQISGGSRHAGVSFLQRTVHRQADGTLVPVQVAAVHVEIEGKGRRIIVVRDLTEIEDARDRLKHIRKALDASPLPALLFDPAWTVKHATPAFARLTGWQSDEVEGRELAALLDPAVALSLRGQSQELARGRSVQAEGGLRLKAGGTLRASLALTPVLDASNRVSEYFAAFHGTPDEAPSAGQAAADVALFFDLLAHDVTNYLTAVRGYLEIVVASEGLASATARMAEVARAQTNNALELIRDTRKVAALQRDPLQALAEGDLVKVLDDAVVRVEPLLQSRKFKVRKEYRIAKAPVKSPDLIREVFVNLLHNAVKFDPHDEVLIDVLLEKTPWEGRPTFLVRIADRGTGVADGDRGRLFERGFKPQAAARRHPDALAPPGSGIGLSLCKFIVERAGGSIVAESRIPGDPTQGTAFLVRLPAA